MPLKLPASASSAVSGLWAGADGDEYASGVPLAAFDELDDWALSFLAAASCASRSLILFSSRWVYERVGFLPWSASRHFFLCLVRSAPRTAYKHTPRSSQYSACTLAARRHILPAVEVSRCNEIGGRRTSHAAVQGSHSSYHCRTFRFRQFSHENALFFGTELEDMANDKKKRSHMSNQPISVCRSEPWHTESSLRDGTEGRLFMVVSVVGSHLTSAPLPAQFTGQPLSLIHI